MSNSSAQQSARIAADRPRNGHSPARARTASQQEREKFVGRRDGHTELIAASFERAEAYQRLGDFERALEWLERAAALCGELPSAYRVKRARWARAAAPRARPATSDWRSRLDGRGLDVPAP